MLESYLRNRLKEKEILLMTHIVLGYPSYDESFKIIETMVEAGVDLMELQFPFSEPTADGPVIVRANQKALEGGSTVEKCFSLAKKATRTFDIPFLVMSYYNILFKYGLGDFASAMMNQGLKGAIIPDLPPEEGREYLKAMKDHNLDPILIFSPTTSPERMRYLSSFASGFIYCIARKGVTGKNTDFSEELAVYLTQCRNATTLPLALGFGIKDKADIDYLKGKADIAVIGSQTIRIMEKEGINGIGDFIYGLR
ncbi:tryptophan synthase subunit alpha [Thermodesulfobacteriota bacterium]